MPMQGYALVPGWCPDFKTMAPSALLHPPKHHRPSCQRFIQRLVIEGSVRISNCPFECCLVSEMRKLSALQNTEIYMDCWQKSAPKSNSKVTCLNPSKVACEELRKSARMAFWIISRTRKPLSSHFEPSGITLSTLGKVLLTFGSLFGHLQR